MKKPSSNIITIHAEKGLHYDLSHFPARHPLQADIWQITRYRAGKPPTCFWFPSVTKAATWVYRETNLPLTCPSDAASHVRDIIIDLNSRLLNT